MMQGLTREQRYRDEDTRTPAPMPDAFAYQEGLVVNSAGAPERRVRRHPGAAIHNWVRR
jgi:hypothetical protein